MSKQIYWATVIDSKSKRIWPMKFFAREHDAKENASFYNRLERGMKHPKNFVVKRFLFEMKNATYYDVYEHEYKRIEK